LGEEVKCANCDLEVEEIEPDTDEWGHVDAAYPFDSQRYERFMNHGCSDPQPETRTLTDVKFEEVSLVFDDTYPILSVKEVKEDGS
jgi:hypothetical protein